METGIAEIESHGEERVGKGVGFGVEDLRAADFPAADDHGGRAIPKQNRGTQVGLGNVFSLKCQRGKFYRDDQNVATGIGF